MTGCPNVCLVLAGQLVAAFTCQGCYVPARLQHDGWVRAFTSSERSAKPLERTANWVALVGLLREHGGAAQGAQCGTPGSWEVNDGVSVHDTCLSLTHCLCHFLV